MRNKPGQILKKSYYLQEPERGPSANHHPLNSNQMQELQIQFQGLKNKMRDVELKNTQMLVHIKNKMHNRENTQLSDFQTQRNKPREQYFHQNQSPPKRSITSQNLRPINDPNYSGSRNSILKKKSKVSREGYDKQNSIQLLSRFDTGQNYLQEDEDLIILRNYLIEPLGHRSPRLSSLQKESHQTNLSKEHQKIKSPVYKSRTSDSNIEKKKSKCKIASLNSEESMPKFTNYYLKSDVHLIMAELPQNLKKVFNTLKSRLNRQIQELNQKILSLDIATEELKRLTNQMRQKQQRKQIKRLQYRHQDSSETIQKQEFEILKMKMRQCKFMLNQKSNQAEKLQEKYDMIWEDYSQKTVELDKTKIENQNMRRRVAETKQEQLNLEQRIKLILRNNTERENKLINQLKQQKQMYIREIERISQEKAQYCKLMVEKSNSNTVDQFVKHNSSMSNSHDERDFLNHKIKQLEFSLKQQSSKVDQLNGQKQELTNKIYEQELMASNLKAMLEELLKQHKQLQEQSSKKDINYVQNILQIKNARQQEKLQLDQWWKQVILKMRNICDQKVHKKIKRQHETRILTQNLEYESQLARNKIIVKDYIEQFHETISDYEKQMKMVIKAFEDNFKISKIECEVSGLEKILETLGGQRNSDKLRIKQLEESQLHLLNQIKNLNNKPISNILNFNEEIIIPKNKRNHTSHIPHLEKQISLKSTQLQAMTDRYLQLQQKLEEYVHISQRKNGELDVELKLIDRRLSDEISVNRELNQTIEELRKETMNLQSRIKMMKNSKESESIKKQEKDAENKKQSIEIRNKIKLYEAQLQKFELKVRKQKDMIEQMDQNYKEAMGLKNKAIDELIQTKSKLTIEYKMVLQKLKNQQSLQRGLELQILELESIMERPSMEQVNSNSGNVDPNEIQERQGIKSPTSQQVARKNQIITELERQNLNNLKQINDLEGQVSKFTSEKMLLNKQIISFKQQIAYLKQEIKEEKLKSQSITNILQNNNQRQQHSEKQWQSQKDQLIDKYESLLQQKQQELQQHIIKYNQVKRQLIERLDEKSDIGDFQQEQNNRRQQLLAEGLTLYENKIKQLEMELNQQKNRIKIQEQELLKAQKTVLTKQVSIQAMEKQHAHNITQIKQQSIQIKYYEEKLFSLREEVDKLENTTQNDNAIKEREKQNIELRVQLSRVKEELKIGQKQLMNQIEKTNEIKEELMDGLDCKSQMVRVLRNQQQDKQKIYILLKQQNSALQSAKKQLQEQIGHLEKTHVSTIKNLEATINNIQSELKTYKNDYESHKQILTQKQQQLANKQDIISQLKQQLRDDHSKDSLITSLNKDCTDKIIAIALLKQQIDVLHQQKQELEAQIIRAKSSSNKINNQIQFDDFPEGELGSDRSTTSHQDNTSNIEVGESQQSFPQFELDLHEQKYQNQKNLNKVFVSPGSPDKIQNAPLISYLLKLKEELFRNFIKPIPVEDCPDAENRNEIEDNLQYALVNDDDNQSNAFLEFDQQFLQKHSAQQIIVLQSMRDCIRKCCQLVKERVLSQQSSFMSALAFIDRNDFDFCQDMGHQLQETTQNFLEGQIVNFESDRNYQSIIESFKSQIKELKSKIDSKQAEIQNLITEREEEEEQSQRQHIVQSQIYKKQIFNEKQRADKLTSTLDSIAKVSNKLISVWSSSQNRIDDLVDCLQHYRTINELLNDSEMEACIQRYDTLWSGVLSKCKKENKTKKWF